MTSTIGQSVGSLDSPSSHRKFVSYIDKSREYYAAHGYAAPYRWAANDDAPFASPPKPLEQATVGLVTTSFPHRDHQPDGSPAPPKEAYAHPIDGRPDQMFTDDLSWDKQATHTDDIESFLPVTRLQELEAAGRIGAVAPRFFGVPTEYSQRKTALDAATVEQWCREDGIDVVLLIPL